MSRKLKETDVPAVWLKNEASRQRWELFHRAIAYAKQTNSDALLDAEASESAVSRPALTVVR